MRPRVRNSERHVCRLLGTLRLNGVEVIGEVQNSVGPEIDVRQLHGHRMNPKLRKCYKHERIRGSQIGPTRRRFRCFQPPRSNVVLERIMRVSTLNIVGLGKGETYRRRDIYTVILEGICVLWLDSVA